ncbi:hypothetical protein NDU88_004494 [Pleurodeles waltl]|uniref:Uncharacterized protein n=1 Tax=Pleurodeles waltl TaxID=8319 RepID=A0AAV7MU26_PLEWA|nr:hypothetical protein NDU88_004494 [Pleurodeles waltl]
MREERVKSNTKKSGRGADDPLSGKEACPIVKADAHTDVRGSTSSRTEGKNSPIQRESAVKSPEAAELLRVCRSSCRLASSTRCCLAHTRARAPCGLVPPLVVSAPRSWLALLHAALSPRLELSPSPAHQEKGPPLLSAPPLQAARLQPSRALRTRGHAKAAPLLTGERTRAREWKDHPRYGET